MGKAFRFIVGAEIAVLLVLLGVWLYREDAKNNATTSGNGSTRTTPRAISSLKTPNGKPKRESIRPSGVLGRSPDVQTAQVSKSPVTFPSTNTENHSRKNARKIETPRYMRRNDPLPALQSPVILIEKSKQRVTVFEGSRIVKQYPASTGQNLGDKLALGVGG